MSNHRLKFRWSPITSLTLIDVWCPGDHGGECDCPEVSDESHDEDCASLADPDEFEPHDDCDCEGRTGNCWAKEQLDEWVANGDGWDEVIEGGIDLPWVAVAIEGPGVDGNDLLAVKVVAEVRSTMSDRMTDERLAGEQIQNLRARPGIASANALGNALVAERAEVVRLEARVVRLEAALTDLINPVGFDLWEALRRAREHARTVLAEGATE